MYLKLYHWRACTKLILNWYKIDIRIIVLSNIINRKWLVTNLSFSRKKLIFLSATSMRNFWLTWKGTFFARTIIARSRNWKNDVLSSVKKYLTPRQESYYNNIILKRVLYQLSNIFCFTRSWDSWYRMIILPQFRKRCDNYISDFKNERVDFITGLKI